MNKEYYDSSPALLKDFFIYHEYSLHHTGATCDGYFLDLRLFFRFLLIDRGVAPSVFSSFDELPISSLSSDFISTVKREDIENFLLFLNSERDIKNSAGEVMRIGLKKVSEKRKITSLKSFYKFLHVTKGLIETDPTEKIAYSKPEKKRIRYLTEEEAKLLLQSVESNKNERDYCILVLLLNLGLRVSELVNLNLSDIRPGRKIYIRGKGNRNRELYLNEACCDALMKYLDERGKDLGTEESPALFLSQFHKRISVDTVQSICHKQFLKAGLDAEHLSAEKLRHSCATMMVNNGVDIETIKDFLGHSLIESTEVYLDAASESIRRASESINLGRGET